jgi:hypothetical protein
MSPSSTAFLRHAERNLLQVLRALVWWYYGEASQIWVHNMRAMTFRDGFPCVDRQLSLIDARLRLGFPSVTSLGELLEMGRRFERSEPRDGIYALLGMVRKDLPAASGRIDYKIPVGRVLEIYTRHVLAERGESYGGMTILLKVSHRKGDIDAREMASWAFRADRAWVRTQDPTDFNDDHDASKGLTLRSEVVLSRYTPSVLTLDGIAVGTTADTISPPTSEDVRDWVCWLRDACIWCERKTSEGPFINDLVRVLAQILCDTAYSGVRTRLKFSHDEALSQTTVLIERCRSWTGSTDPAEDMLSQQHVIESALSPWSYQALDRVRHRRLFKSRDDRLGLGPGVMQTGDIVDICSLGLLSYTG